jgi:hypothetical protein
MKNVTYKEIKVGSVTVYQQNFQFLFDEKAEPGKGRDGQAFFVAEGKYIVTGRLDDLRKVLERNKKPELSSDMQTGLKYADFSNPAMLVLDVQSMPSRDKESMIKGLPWPGVKEAVDAVQAVAVRAKENGKLAVSAAAFCKDAAGAAQVKKVADAGLADLKAKIKGVMEKGDPKAPPQIAEMMKEFDRFLGGVKVAVKDSQVNVSSDDAAPALVMLFAWMTPSEKAKDK